MSKVTIQDLLNAGVHFGHQTSRWNPKMKSYIHGPRGGIYIIDLVKSMQQLEKACRFIYETVLEDGKILFIGTKRQAQAVVRDAAESVGMYYVCERWLGGMLTNHKTIQKSIDQLEDINQKKESGELDKLPKKEASRYRRKANKLDRYLSGITTMRKKPSALIVVDTEYENIAVHEANRMKIPVIGIVDTNCNPDLIDFVIPGNDDSQRAIKVMLDTMINTIKIVQEAQKEEEMLQESSETSDKSLNENSAEQAEETPSTKKNV